MISTEQVEQSKCPICGEIVEIKTETRPAKSQPSGAYAHSKVKWESVDVKVCACTKRDIL